MFRALEKNVYSAAFGWHVLQISIKSIWPNASFRACVSLRIFCLDDLSIVVSRVLKPPTMIVLLLICPFKVVSSCLIYCGEPLLDA